MKRILLALLLTFAFAVPSFGAATGSRDVQPEILAMFRAQVADLTDFDPGLCTETGTYGLISTNGVWSCEDATDLLDHSNYLVHSGFQNDMKVSICGHNNTTDNCATYNWYINTLGGGYFEAIYTDSFALFTNHTDNMNFGNIGKTVDNYFFNSGTGLVTLNGGVTAVAPFSAPDGTAGAPSYSFTGTPTTGLFLSGANPVISVAGVGRYYFTASYLQSMQIRVPDGVVGSPSYTFLTDPTTGLYTTGTGYFRITTAGSLAMTLNSVGSMYLTGKINAAGGAVGVASYAFNSDASTGMYQVSAGNIGFTSAGTHAATLNATSFTVGTLNAGDASNTFQILAGGDGANAPGYSWLGDPDTGLMHGTSANNMIFRAASGSVMSIWGDRLEMWQKIWIDDGGSLALPGLGFRDDPNTGLWQVTDGDGDIDFVSDGVHAATLNAAGLTIPGTYVGSVTAQPTFTFAGDETTGYAHVSGVDSRSQILSDGSINLIFAGSWTRSIQPLYLRQNTSKDTPALGFWGDTNTGIYQVTDADHDIDFTSNGTHAATLNAAGLTLTGGITPGPTANLDWIFTAPADFNITLNNTSQTGVSPFYLRANNFGTGATTDAITLAIDNEGSGGSMDGLVIIALPSDADAAYAYAIRIEHQENVGAMYAAIDVRGTSTGVISYGLKVDDPEINYAMSIGSNRINTDFGIVEASELGILVDGLSLDDVDDPTAGVEKIWNFSGTGIRFVYNNDTGGAGFPLQVKGYFNTANDSGDAFNIVVEDKGAGGTAVNALGIVFSDSVTGTSYGAGVKVTLNDPVDRLYYGLRVISSGAPISFGVYVEDSDIETAIHIGANDFETSVTKIAAADFDVVFGGVASDANAQHTHSRALYSTSLTIQDTDTGDCLASATGRAGSLGSVGCTANNVVGTVIVADATITHTRVWLSVKSAQAGAKCRIVAIDQADSAAYGTSPAQWDFDGDGDSRTYIDFDDTDWDVTDGDIIEFALSNQGGTACTSTTAPYLNLTLYGYETS